MKTIIDDADQSLAPWENEEPETTPCKRCNKPVNVIVTPTGKRHDGVTTQRPCASLKPWLEA